MAHARCAHDAWGRCPKRRPDRRRGSPGGDDRRATRRPGPCGSPASGWGRFASRSRRPTGRPRARSRDRNMAPAGLKSRARTPAPPWSSSRRSLPVRASQTCAVPSAPPVAARPSGLKATAKLPYCRRVSSRAMSDGDPPDRSQNSTSPWYSPTSTRLSPVGRGPPRRRRSRFAGARRLAPLATSHSLTLHPRRRSRACAVAADAHAEDDAPAAGGGRGRAIATRRPRTRGPLLLTGRAAAVRGEREVGRDLAAGIHARRRARSGRPASRSSTPPSFRPTAISFPSGLYLPGCRSYVASKARS